MKKKMKKMKEKMKEKMAVFSTKFLLYHSETLNALKNLKNSFVMYRPTY